MQFDTTRTQSQTANRGKQTFILVLVFKLNSRVYKAPLILYVHRTVVSNLDNLHHFSVIQYTTEVNLKFNGISWTQNRSNQYNSKYCNGHMATW